MPQLRVAPTADACTPACIHCCKRKELTNENSQTNYLGTEYLTMNREVGTATHVKWLTVYDYNATEQHSFCNLGTSTTRPSSSTVLLRNSSLLQGWLNYKLHIRHTRVCLMWTIHNALPYDILRFIALNGPMPPQRTLPTVRFQST